MFKETKRIYIIEFLLLVLTLLCLTIEDTMKREFYSICSVGIVLFISLLVYGKKKDNNALKISATRIIVSGLLFFFIIVFLLGLSLGYSKTLFSLNVHNWFNGLIPAIILTVIMESLRFILIVSNPFERKGIWILTILFIILNVGINTNYYAFSNGYRVFVFFCVTVFPVIAQEALSSYIVYQYGFLPAFVYKLVMNLYLYVIPYMTNLGDYLYSAFHVVIPFALFMTLRKSLHFANDARRNESHVKRTFIAFVTVPTLIVMALLVVLVSGIYDYKMIAIASDSMEPYFDRGDAIIYEKVSEEDDIYIGDILVFYRENKIISHRVVKIGVREEGKVFYTKGDSNNDMDPGYSNMKEVLGIVRSSVKYIGYPTVLFHEMIGGE